MPVMLPFALMLMQVGVDPMGGQVPGVPEELRNRPARKAPPGVDPAPPAIAVCLETARTDPARARAIAEEWVRRTQGETAAAGHHCLGVAAANLGDWEGASAAFAAARDLATQPRFTARMGALAGAALLARDMPVEALETLDRAKTEAGADAILGGSIETDRARALVVLSRPQEAVQALAEARSLTPDDAQVWLLSATLSRRQEDLVAAQAQIEKAAALAPRDLDIGLEAGVIAALAGREEAALRSFRSVVAADAASPQADIARRYLEQMEPRPSSDAVAQDRKP